MFAFSLVPLSFSSLIWQFKAIIEMQTGVKQQTPLEWPFTQLSNENQLRDIRLSMFTLRLLPWSTCNLLLHRLPQGDSEHHRSGFVSCVFKARN